MRKPSVVLISGGLGNQLFEYSFFLYLRKVFPGHRFALNASYFKRYGNHSGFELPNLFDLSAEDIDDRDFYRWHNLIVLNVPSLYSFFLKRNVYCDESNLDFSSPARIYNDYWVFFRYYEQVRDEFNASFRQSVMDDIHGLDIYRKIAACDSFFIHIRRGDYVGHGKYVDLSATEYYANALRHVRDRRDGLSWFVFSDDIPWCRENLASLVDDATFVEYPGQSPTRDMLLMASCKVGGITANSTFSWWGALLGDEGRIIIHPDRYFTQKVVDYDYPSTWTEVATGWRS